VRRDGDFSKSLWRRGVARFAVVAMCATVFLATGPVSAVAASRPGLIIYTAFPTGGDSIGAVPYGPSTGAALFAAGGIPLANVTFPRWAPNGETFAFNDGFHIYLASRSGHLLTTLLDYPGGVGAMDWSPDGRKIAFACNSAIIDVQDDGAQMCVLNVITGTVTHLTRSSNLIYVNSTGGPISWSPNGDEIAFSSFEMVPACSGAYKNCVVHYAVAVVNTKSGVVSQITNYKERASEPAFSPDGHEISYYGRGTHVGLDIMSTQGVYIRQVYDAATCARCESLNSAWSPDGKMLVYAAPDKSSTINLFTVNAVGGPEKQLTTSGTDLGLPDWTALATTCTVPKVVGLAVDVAKLKIELAGCTVGTVTGPSTDAAKRRVVIQGLKQNTNVTIGSPVNIKIQ